MATYEELTTGASVAGFNELSSYLKTEVITAVQDKINDVTDIENSIKDAWAGQACDTFLQKFTDARTAVCNDLSAEIDNLVHRLTELQAMYVAIDQNLMGEDG